MTTGALKILRIELDSHYHGSSDVPRPWVAAITGVDATYGLARTFVQRLNDWRNASRSCRGNLRGVVAAFPLHEGQLYEVSRLRGRSSKRYVSREFAVVADGQVREVEPLDALAIAERYVGPALAHEAPEGTRISRVVGLGTPLVCGFALVGRDRDVRLFRLRAGAVHEVDTGTDRYLAIAGEARLQRVSQDEALAHLSPTASTEAA